MQALQWEAAFSQAAEFFLMKLPAVADLAHYFVREVNKLG